MAAPLDRAGLVALNPRIPSAGLARVLSKLGYCSRREAETLIRAGRVQVDNRVCHDVARVVDLERATITVNGRPVGREASTYIMLNKPRGLVTTTSDERGRDTVYRCFEGANLPRLIPVGRLDQSSEGLLLFTNDTAWANGITDPAYKLDKTYHVHITSLASAELLSRLRSGVVDEGETLRAKRVVLLRNGSRNCWLEIVLNEGRNRQIRRMVRAVGLDVLQLVRVAVGGLPLGSLPKGKWRPLTPTEVAIFRPINPA